MSAGSGLNEPFADLERQRLSAAFGMWIFLASEILFFGALFLSFTIYRQLHPQAMLEAARETNVVLGTVNTAILLASSVTMAVADKAAERGLKRHTLVCLAVTMALGISFLVVKGFEYREDLEKHLLPGPSFALSDAASQIFYGFYWAMTAIHAIHLTIGIAAVALVFVRIQRNHLAFRQSATLPVLGLYWHLVDIVWIFIYPLLYLGGRT